jgi:hypothetical protein
MFSSRREGTRRKTLATARKAGMGRTKDGGLQNRRQKLGIEVRQKIAQQAANGDPLCHCHGRRD